MTATKREKQYIFSTECLLKGEPIMIMKTTSRECLLKGGPHQEGKW